ncbi:bifunctional phosphoribosylaminoimidazolecarboxamide formyltransferase/IMP cyclohydrolase PurH [Candidatus Fermentibacteria bacterium]|nr:MAG: bifunctional phosphoribosylaminoimidazolecarboxamide formyltransferase/IMP cyclohydrolase PurH [Candidatus Fermentibacteria bacterium]
MENKRRQALVSAWDKTGLVEFARGLSGAGWQIWASGGTAAKIEEAGISVRRTEEITGIGSILGGRVKTLHPELHAAILAAGSDREDRIREGKPVFDLVAVDLYPFHKTACMAPDSSETIELVDIGGPSMARGAAKNWAHVISATGSDSFSGVLETVLEGTDDELYRRKMASRTFSRTAMYDLSVAMKLEEGIVPALRYGENPHQKAAVHFSWPRSGFGAAEVLGGKALSYNNYLDASAAVSIAADMKLGGVSVVLAKHGNPCGAGVGSTAAEAFQNAFRADRVSPYGGILACTGAVDIELVKALKGIFLEIVIAPEFHEDALARLQKRKNLRILRMAVEEDAALQLRSISGGLLAQMPDLSIEDVLNCRVVTKRKPSSEELAALNVNWRVVKGVKSNAIVVGDSRGTIGVGIGQPSRIESIDLALRRAVREGNEVKGAVLASDAFFPFRDGPDKAAEAGITAIIQPGGSIRDEEVIQACNEHGIAMVFTDTRHFRH